jgi:hypothetical protein
VADFLTRLRRPRADDGAPAEPERAPEEAGRILAPAPGSAVSGVVAVAIEPARTGQPVDFVRLEWSHGDGWTRTAELDERTYELELESGGAIVRSQELADALAELFETELEPSRRRPWAGWRRVELAWDTSRVPLGPAALRAVTVDAAGSEIPTPPIDVVVAIAPGTPPEPEHGSEGEAVAEPETEPAPLLAPRARRSWAVLEAAIDSHPELDAWRRESLETLLHYLIRYAEPDGTLPEQFDGLVEEEFGDLLDVTW